VNIRIDLDYGTIERVGEPGVAIGRVSRRTPGDVIVSGFLDPPEPTDEQLDKALAEMAQWTRLPYGVKGEHVVVFARTEEEARQLNRTAMRRILAAVRRDG